MSSSSPAARVGLLRVLAITVCTVCILTLAVPGCGSSDSTTEAMSSDQQKVQDLMKKGMNLSQIRKTMKGEPLESKKTTKKKARSH